MAVDVAIEINDTILVGVEMQNNEIEIEIDFLSGVTITEITNELINEGSMFIAGEILPGQRAVWLNAGKIYLFDPANLQCFDRYVGITKTSAVADDEVEVIAFGLFNHNGMNLIQDEIYFAGAAGVLTSTPPSPVEQIIGVAQDANNIYLYESESIETV